MRDYAVVSSKFWTGETGRYLRNYPDAQLLALYLLTCPNSNMIGLYYIPIPTICHELNMTREGASEALRRVSEGGFARFDEATETVFVPEMARFQVGENLKQNDNRIRSVEKTLEGYRKSPFFNDFVKKYGRAFRLKIELNSTPFEAPSKALARGSLQEQEQEQEQDKKTVAVATAIPRHDFEEKPPAEFRQFTDYFVEAWSKRYRGAKYIFQKADGPAAAGIFKSLGGSLDKGKRVIDLYMGDTDPFYEKNGHTLRFLYSRINTFIGMLAGTAPLLSREDY